MGLFQWMRSRFSHWTNAMAGFHRKVIRFVLNNRLAVRLLPGADELGFTNTYTTQLLLGQAQLKPDTLPKLKKAVPGISEADLETLQKAPFRGWDPEILKEPNVYRTYEAITHYGNAIKLLINEKFGDGIMSAIDFYMTVGGTVGKMGEKRVVITFNGKFLPFIEQVAADNSAASPEIAE